MNFLEVSAAEATTLESNRSIGHRTDILRPVYTSDAGDVMPYGQIDRLIYRIARSIRPLCVESRCSASKHKRGLTYGLTAVQP